MSRKLKVLCFNDERQNFSYTQIKKNLFCVHMEEAAAGGVWQFIVYGFWYQSYLMFLYVHIFVHHHQHHHWLITNLLKYE